MKRDQHLLKKSYKILIPNATSPKNIGDQAALSGLIGLIKKARRGVKIKIHSVDPNIYAKAVEYEIDHTLYSWSVFKNRRIISRFINLSKLIVQYIFLRFGVDGVSIDRQLNCLIRDYKNADLIIFVGGGYLRCRKGIKQTLNLLMLLLVFKYAGLFSAKKIVAPISVGPFGYKWLERIVVNVLKHMDLVAVREEFSYNKLKKYGMKNIIFSSDHALMIKKINKKNTHRKFILGFTIREWLSGSKYINFENSFAGAIQEFCKLTGAKIQPIVQVDASMYGEDDVLATQKIIGKLKNKNIDVLKIKKPHTVRGALEVCSNIDLILGMRMHSNILAAIQGTPFVAVSYEHKTEGIAKQFAMEKYCIRCEDVDKESLFKLLVAAYKNRSYLKTKLANSIKTIQNEEMKRWRFIL